MAICRVRLGASHTTYARGTYQHRDEAQARVDAISVDRDVSCFFLDLPGRIESLATRATSFHDFPDRPGTSMGVHLTVGGVVSSSTRARRPSRGGQVHGDDF